MKKPIVLGILSKLNLLMLIVSISLGLLLPLGRATAASDITFNNANSWNFYYSKGLPSKPYANYGGGWYFDFPVQTEPLANCLTKSCNTANLLLTPYTTPIVNKSLSMTVKVATTGNPVFNYKFESGNNCPVPASAHLYFQRNNDYLGSEYNRWWSNPIAFQIKSTDSVDITVPFTPENWSSVYGKFANYDNASLAGFNDAVKNPGYFGITFGGGCFFGHGVNVSGGTARFTVTNFRLTDAGSALATYTKSSIVSSASSLPKLAAKSWATVYGQDLISDPTCPIPSGLVLSLCGTSVKVNDSVVYLNYASKNQVNFQLPNLVGSNIRFQVNNKNGAGKIITIDILNETLDLYSQTSNGKGLVLAQHWATPNIKQGTLVTPTNPASANSTFVIYASGLGKYSNLSSKPTIKINNRDLPAGNIINIDYTDGLNRIYVKDLPLASLGITATGSYPIQLTAPGVSGNSLSIAIKY